MNTFISKCFSEKYLKHCLTHALLEIKHLVRGRDDNKALGFTLCFNLMLCMFCTGFTPFVKLLNTNQQSQDLVILWA